MMFNPAQFLETPIYQFTPAARMALTGLELSGIVGVQSRLQSQHHGTIQSHLGTLTSQDGALIFTQGPYCLRVVDCIIPEDYVRRTYICMDTEANDIRIKIFRAAGLIPSNKEE